MSLYSPDVHSAGTAGQMMRFREPVLLTPLGEAELTNALELRIFRKEATETQIRQAQSKFREHVMGGYLRWRKCPRLFTSARNRLPENELHA
jgi:hypothetical protein